MHALQCSNNTAHLSHSGEDLYWDMTWITDVLHFWFETLEPADWFAGKPELDDIIWDRFGDLRQDMKAAPPDARCRTRGR